MTSTCFGHLHVHLQECLYVVSLPHAAVIQHISTPEDGHVNVRNM